MWDCRRDYQWADCPINFANTKMWMKIFIVNGSYHDVGIFVDESQKLLQAPETAFKTPERGNRRRKLQYEIRVMSWFLNILSFLEKFHYILENGQKTYLRKNLATLFSAAFSFASRYSRKTRISWTMAMMRAPNASVPRWYLQYSISLISTMFNFIINFSLKLE